MASDQELLASARGAVGTQGSPPCAVPLPPDMLAGGVPVPPVTAPPTTHGGMRTLLEDGGNRVRDGQSEQPRASHHPPRRDLILAMLALALGPAIMALVLADGVHLSGWLLLGVLLLADGVLRLLSLARLGWSLAAALGVVLAVGAVAVGVRSWGSDRDRPPEREVGGISAPARTAQVPRPSPQPVASPVMTPAAIAPPSVTPAAAPTPSPPAAPPAPVRYVVQPGDTLIDIAAFFGARTQDIIALNRLPPDGRILAGQELLIPRTP